MANIIHRFYKNATLNHYSSLDQAVKDSRNYKLLYNNLSKKFNLSKNYPKYFDDRYNATFDNTIKEAATGLGLTDKRRFGSFALQSRQEMLAMIATLRDEADGIKEDFQKISAAIEKIDDFEVTFSQQLAELAITNPLLRQIMGIKESDIPNGRYDINTAQLFSTVNGQIKYINILIAKAQEKGRSIDDVKGIGWAIYQAYSKLAGFLQEAEMLKGLIQADKEGNAIFLHTGVLYKEIKNDVKLSEDEKAYQNMLKEIDSIVQGITSSTPKADIIGYKDGVYAGISIKTASEAKLGFKGFSRSKAIPLGSTYKAILQILSENQSTISNILGLPYLDYLTQTIVSIHKAPNGDTTDYTNTAQNDLRTILDLASTLAAVEGLVGICKDFNKGAATYLVVNGHIYDTQDVLNAILKTLEITGRTGVYYENQGKGSDVKNTILIGDQSAQELLDLPGNLSSEEYTRMSKSKTKEIINNLNKVHISIGLNALIEHGKLMER